MNQFEELIKDVLSDKEPTAVFLADLLETFLFSTSKGAKYLEGKGFVNRATIVADVCASCGKKLRVEDGSYEIPIPKGTMKSKCCGALMPEYGVMISGNVVEEVESFGNKVVRYCPKCGKGCEVKEEG